MPYKMSLETEVQDSVNAWDISLIGPNSEEVSYSDLVRPLLYGIGIGITGKLVNEIQSYVGISQQEDYMDLDYPRAVRQFKREYLARHLKRHSFSGVETGVAIGLGNSRKTARESLAHILRREFGVHSAKKLRDETGDVEYTEATKVDTQLVGLAIQEIERYSSFFRQSIFRSLLDNKSKIIAEQFVGIAKRHFGVHNHFFDMTYHEAIAGFKKWYLTQQIKESGSGTKAAEKVGLSAGAFRQLIHTQEIKVAEVLKK